MQKRRGAWWTQLVRYLYGRTSPWHVEHAVMSLAQRLRPLQSAPVRMKDGRILYLDLRNPVAMPYLMQGDFPCEGCETEFVRSVVRPGDTVLDIGANVGWYSSLLSQLVGDEGRVFAFEPNRGLADLLLRLARELPQLRVEPVGVGESDCEARFSVPENWVSGSFGKTEEAVEEYHVPIRRLDTFMERSGVPEVTFVKCDAEGAELDILRGASRALTGPNAPIWLLEMSSEETAKFGYHPRMLADFFGKNGGAHFRAYMIDGESGDLSPLSIPHSEPFWFNAVFVPARLEERISPPATRPSPAESRAVPRPLRMRVRTISTREN